MFVGGTELCFIRFLHAEQKGGEMTGRVWNSDGLGCWPCGNVSSWSFAGGGWKWGPGGRQGLVDPPGDRRLSCTLQLAGSLGSATRGAWLGPRVSAGGQRARGEMTTRRKRPAPINKARDALRPPAASTKSWRSLAGNCWWTPPRAAALAYGIAQYGAGPPAPAPAPPAACRGNSWGAGA